MRLTGPLYNFRQVGMVGRKFEEGPAGMKAISEK